MFFSSHFALILLYRAALRKPAPFHANWYYSGIAGWGEANGLQKLVVDSMMNALRQCRRNPLLPLLSGVLQVRIACPMWLNTWHVPVACKILSIHLEWYCAQRRQKIRADKNCIQSIVQRTYLGYHRISVRITPKDAHRLVLQHCISIHPRVFWDEPQEVGSPLQWVA